MLQLQSQEKQRPKHLDLDLKYNMLHTFHRFLMTQRVVDDPFILQCAVIKE
jgi:hypothetical protein